MATDSIVDYNIDDLFAASGTGSLDKAIGLNMYGINYQQAPTAVPRNKEQPGYTFFTRPQLNMQRDNIANARQFYNLMTDDPLSQERYIRCMLDPRLAAGYVFQPNKQIAPVVGPTVTCPILDNENCFITNFTNDLMTITGWPEETMTFQRSKEDVYRGTRTQPNGVTMINSSYTVSATFRNTRNNPILKMIHYWMMYMSFTTTTGILRPYADFEAMDRLDCNTRIYRITLDAQRDKVTGIYACGAALPSANAISAFADYNRNTPISEVNKDFTISFECDGFLIFDPIMYYTFNSVVQAFCPGMRDANREGYMVKLSKAEQNYFRGVAYPRINPSDSSFEIWVPRGVYQARMQDLGSIMGEDYIDSPEPTE